MKNQRSLFERIKENLSTWSIEQWLYVFFAVLVLLTIIAARNMFSQTIFLTSPTPQTNTFTLSNKDFGKTISVSQGDTVLLSLKLPQDMVHSLTVAPQGILNEQSALTLGADNTYQTAFQAVSLGTTNVTVTSRAKCPSGSLCPAFILLNFKATISVVKK